MQSGKIKASEFDMGTFSSFNSCKTTHCIGGWVDLELGGTGGNPLGRLYLSPTLYGRANNLFMPSNPEAYGATRKQAIEAIDNLLNTRKSNPWQGVIK